MKSGTIFDNFLITDDEKLAEEIGNETWGATKVRGGDETPLSPPGTPQDPPSDLPVPSCRTQRGR